MNMKRLFLVISLFAVLLSANAVNEDRELWQLVTSDYEAEYVGAPVANGGIGIMPWREPFSIRQVVLNHVFDENEKSRGVSQVLKGINPFLLEMTLGKEKIMPDNISNWSQTIDMKEATHCTRFTFDGKAEVSYTVRALRNMMFAGLIEVEVTPLVDVEMKVVNRMDVPEAYEEIRTDFRSLSPRHVKKMNILCTTATSKHRKMEVTAASGFIFTGEKSEPVLRDEVAFAHSFTKKLKKGEVYRFALVGSVCSRHDFYDARNEAERQVIYASREGVERLVEAHNRMWAELWQGDVRIEGDDDAQRTVRFALFNLYGFCRENSRLSISPMGLSSQGYNGHVFWDAELWMYPPMLLLNRGIAESMMNYRIDRMEAARKRAMSYGYQGVMYPWESDDSGMEACPTGALAGTFEHHITACIGIACWNHYCVTRDKEWLCKEGYPLIKEVADFWLSRVVRNEDGSCSIRGVMGADEYVEWVDDNSFTNGAAVCALRNACKAAKVCGEKPHKEWSEVADAIRILSFNDGVTREHATYNGEMIKQADANLLAYPLGLITDKEQWKKDLEYYGEKINKKDGPAMGYSIFAIQYARMGETDKAYDMFLRCYKPNWRAPFGVLAESAIRQNPYFATGAGGMLQAVINGFCGLQITDKGIMQVPSVLPKHWKKVTVTGVGPNKETFVREN